MIEADIYGIIPNANTDNRSRAPPENMLNMSRIVPRCCSNMIARAAGSIPGTGINVPKR